MFRNILAAAIIATSAGAVATPAIAAVDFYVQIAPPAPRLERVPPPRRGHAWAPGHWEWGGHRYHWVTGTWIRARPGYRYSGPRWVERGGRWHMERGRWGRDRDRDGIPNRVDRDRDNDGVRNRFDDHPNNPRRR